MSKRIHDCVFYWVGGTERGEWRQADAPIGELDHVILSLERMGYVALPGCSRIGAPDTPPSAERINTVLRANLPATLR